MKKCKLLQSIMLLCLTVATSQASDDGFYVGANVALITLGENSMEVEYKDKTKTTYHKISSYDYGLKIGYQHFDGNRVELYFRQNELGAKEGDISTKTIGINYEWAFSSLTYKELLPYASLGFGFGKSSSSKLKVVDDVDVGETTFGLGVRYQYNKNIDVQIGYQHIIIGFNSSNDKKIANKPDIGQNNIMVSMAYKF